MFLCMAKSTYIKKKSYNIYITSIMVGIVVFCIVFLLNLFSSLKLLNLKHVDLTSICLGTVGICFTTAFLVYLYNFGLRKSSVIIYEENKIYIMLGDICNQMVILENELKSIRVTFAEDEINFITLESSKFRKPIILKEEQFDLNKIYKFLINSKLKKKLTIRIP